MSLNGPRRIHLLINRQIFSVFYYSNIKKRINRKVLLHLDVREDNIVLVFLQNIILRSLMASFRTKSRSEIFISGKDTRKWEKMKSLKSLYLAEELECRYCLKG